MSPSSLAVMVPTSRHVSQCDVGNTKTAGILTAVVLVLERASVREAVCRMAERRIGITTYEHGEDILESLDLFLRERLLLGALRTPGGSLYYRNREKSVMSWSIGFVKRARAREISMLGKGESEGTVPRRS